MTVTAATSNGQSRRPMPCGIYAPTMTFFDPETEDLDIATIKKHAERLARAGLAGLTVMGSNGEAVHCTREEKLATLRATREALDAAGFPSMPIIFGATESSVRGTVELCRLGAEAGADYCLLLPPSYYRAQVNEAMVEDYFIAVADASPLPVVCYNYPGAVSGVDMDSDLLARLAKRHPNIVGTKFTCGNTGKLTRVALAVDAKTPSGGGNYMAFGGLCDFTVQTLASGGSGIIAGGANVMPKVCVRVWELYAAGKRDEAVGLQKLLARGDWFLTKSAVAGTKAALQAYYGYGGFPRRPLARVGEEKVAEITAGIKEIMDVENSL